jgi:hypothetical protein
MRSENAVGEENNEQVAERPPKRSILRKNGHGCVREKRPFPETAHSRGYCTGSSIGTFATLVAAGNSYTI